MVLTHTDFYESGIQVLSVSKYKYIPEKNAQRTSFATVCAPKFREN